jgi:hypothetical protein
MATYTWSIPAGKEIIGSTKIIDTDNHIGDTIDDLVDFVNGEGSHNGQGLSYDLVDRVSSQTISGDKTFTGGLTGTLTGDVVGNITGDLTGNADTAAVLETSRTIAGASFNGGSDVDISFNDLLDKPDLFISGMVMLWSGNSTNVPSGWLLCDGNNGTPNLVGKFVKGSTLSGGTGGSETTSSNGSHNHTTGDHTLTINEMPSHKHEQKHGLYQNNDYYDNSSAYGNNGTWNAIEDAESYTGGGASHNHGDTSASVSHTHTIEPVHYELCYIMRG